MTPSPACRLSFEPTLLALLVLLVLLAPFVGTTGAAHAALAFEDTVHVQQRGDVVRFDVHFADSGHDSPYSDPDYEATTANVSIAGHGYEAVVEVHDDGDGEVGFRFDTYAAGHGRPNETFAVATPGDRVTVRRATATDELLRAGEYNVTGAVGNVSKEREEDTVALVDLRQPSLDGLTVLRGDPGLASALRTPGDVAAARRDGRIDRAYERRGRYTGGPERSVPVVGEGETLVLALHASGLGGAFGAATPIGEGPNATARFESLLGRELAFAVEWVPEPQFDARRYRFESFAERRVVPDPRNDTYYLLVHTGAGATPISRSESVDVDDPGGVYETTVSVPPDSRLATGNGSDSVTANHTFVPPRAAVTVDAPDRLLVAADEPVTLPVTTTLRPGTELAVRIRGPAGRYVPPEQHVTVNASGRAIASVDPTNVSPGDRFAVVLSRDGRVLGEFDAQVATAIVDFRDRRVDDASAVVVDAVGTSVGGFVALHRGGPNGSVVGTSAYLAPGDHVDVRVPLRQSLDGNAPLWAVMHWDVDGDREFDAVDRQFGTSLPGHLSGVPAAAQAANVTVVETPSAVGTSTVESSTTTSTASPPRRTPTRSGQSTVPGFGPLLAVVAVLAVALGRRRR